MLAGELWNCLWKHIGGGQMQRSALQDFPHQGPFFSNPLGFTLTAFFVTLFD